jgi:undecaprenyl-phosphate 4-deoxy-4-formamido-L-arabinose transferase
MISLVIPVYNEEENLHILIFIDDGSRDSSLSILKGFASEPEVKVVELVRNYGQHAAILAGFSVVTGDIIITLDADLQNPPEEIPKLVKEMEAGSYDVVGTIRKGRKDSMFRIIPSKIINIIARRITKVRMTDWGCMLRAYRRPVVDRMIACHEHATFIPALATFFGKRVTEIEVAHDERAGGTSNYPIRKLINLQFDLVSSFSDLPMKLLMYGGVCMALGGVCFGIFLAVARLAYGALWAAEGVFTLFAILFVFVGLQFFAFGIVGEYIGRIYSEVRKRPEYVIEKVHSSESARQTQ